MRIAVLILSILFVSCEKITSHDSTYDICAKMDDPLFVKLCRYYDKNGDGKVSPFEARSIDRITVEQRDLISMKGIEYFVGLTRLDCPQNSLSSLDLSSNRNLERLDCGYNMLGSLNVSKNEKLEFLGCEQNHMSSLTLPKNSLITKLECWNNDLTLLDVSESPALVYLDCGKNKLTSLDVTKNANLETLRCEENKLTSLDLSNNWKLEKLLCYDNELTSLDISTTKLFFDFNSESFDDIHKKGSGSDLVIFLSKSQYSMAKRIHYYNASSDDEFETGMYSQYRIILKKKD